MTQQSLEARLQRLEDIEAIKQLMWIYTYSLDYGELDKVLDCFADDAIIEVGMRGEAGEAQVALEGRYEGKETIRNFYSLVLSPKDRFVVAHLVLNPVVTVDGDHAKGIFYLLEPSAIKRAMWGQGRYDMEFLRIDGKWVISFFGFSWNFNSPIDEGWVRTPMALV
jgi:hypothetical protein